MPAPRTPCRAALLCSALLLGFLADQIPDPPGLALVYPRQTRWRAGEGGVGAVTLSSLRCRLKMASRCGGCREGRGALGWEASAWGLGPGAWRVLSSRRAAGFATRAAASGVCVRPHPNGAPNAGCPCPQPSCYGQGMVLLRPRGSCGRAVLLPCPAPMLLPLQPRQPRSGALLLLFLILI